MPQSSSRKPQGLDDRDEDRPRVGRRLRPRWPRASTATLALVGTTATFAACRSDFSNPVVATRPVRHIEVALTPAGSDLAATSIEYVGNLEGPQGLSTEDSFAVVSQTDRGIDGLRHARLQQLHEGLVVLGAEVTTHADGTTFLGYSGVLSFNLDGIDVAPSIDADAALAAARAELASRFPEVDPAMLGAGGAAPELFLLPRGADDVALVWRVDLATGARPSLELGHWVSFVDARSAAVLSTGDALQSVLQGSGEGGTDRRPLSWAGQLDVEARDGRFVMETEDLVTVSVLDPESFLGQTEVVGAGTLDGFTDRAANDAHGFAEATLAMLRDWIGIDSIDEKGFRITSRVNAGAFGNAFWEGTFKEITYGDGDDRFFHMSSSIDIVGHEIMHGFTDFHSGLGPIGIVGGMAGGLNESFSDVAGLMVRLHHFPERADEGGVMRVGADAHRDAAGFIRDLCDPTADGRSIDHVDDYDNGLFGVGATNVHASAGIPNKAFCLAVARFAALRPGPSSTRDSVHTVGRVWFAANGNYWTSIASFADACQGVLDAGRALGLSGEELEVLRSSWADVGVHCDAEPIGCRHEDGACDIHGGETSITCPEECGKPGYECSPFEQFKCDIVGLGCSCPQVGGCGDGVCAEDEDDASCGQDCGCAFPAACDTVAPAGCYCDASCEASGDCCVDVGLCRG